MPAIAWLDILRMVGGLVPVATNVVRSLTSDGCSIDGCPMDVRDVVLPRGDASASREMRQAREDARLRIFGPDP